MEKHWYDHSMYIGMSDTFKTRTLVYGLYKLGIINWNTFNKALEKIARVERGDWMFESPRDNAKK